MNRLKINYIKLLLKAIWAELFGKESKRYIIRRVAGPVSIQAYEILDTYMGGVIKHEQYKLREHEAQAVADALNRVVVPRVEKESEVA